MSGGSLAVVRIVFGLVGVISMVRVVRNGWIQSLYAGPAHHFTYPGFGWVRPPSTTGMYVLVAVVGLASAAIAAGWCFRTAMVVFSVGFAWIELVDVTTYLNHYWFMTLVGLLMLAAPVTNELAPAADHAPVRAGWIWLLRAQVGAVYLFAGVAKLHADWLLRAMPLRLWLPTRSEVPLVGPLLDERWFAFAASWAGALFDCTVVGFLLWRRTRLAAWIAVITFHLVTWRLFSIGVFPWLMIGATTIFFDPAWPLRLHRRLQPLLRSGTPEPATASTGAPAAGRFVGPLALTWVAIQVVIPLRHLAIEGDERWTLEGYRWSWNVLLTERGGSVSFRITDVATGLTTVTDATDEYTPLQWKQMSSDPELIRQAAHHLATREESRGRTVEVRADAFVSLNGRPATRLIDPSVDLSRQPWRLGHQPWVLAAPRTSAP